MFSLVLSFEGGYLRKEPSGSSLTLFLALPSLQTTYNSFVVTRFVIPLRGTAEENCPEWKKKQKNCDIAVVRHALACMCVLLGHYG